MRILLTGATGTVGRALLKALYAQPRPFEAVAAVRDPERAQQLLPSHKGLTYKTLDYTRPATFAMALAGVDVVFWLRPPQLNSTKQHFEPFVKAMKAAGIHRVLLLSMQGADQYNQLPHAKMERLLRRYGIASVVVRASYFMQNLTTTLYQDIREKRQIRLPAGSGRFNWIDVHDIARACAQLLLDFDQHRRHTYTLTGSESLNFDQVTEILNRVLSRPIGYRAMDPLAFYWYKYRQGHPPAYIMALLWVHLLPRFQSTPTLTTDYYQLTGTSPTTLLEFARREATILDAHV